MNVIQRFFFFLNSTVCSAYSPQRELAFSVMGNSVLINGNTDCEKIRDNFLTESVRIGSLGTLVWKDGRCRCRKTKLTKADADTVK